ncbi:MAG: hypothetical protein LBJ97_01070 [Mycoplasmataceae bacterium]|nr:hypothetical protein [Mycoplasmataceae bacterium]
MKKIIFEKINIATKKKGTAVYSEKEWKAMKDKLDHAKKCKQSNNLIYV